MIIKKRFSLYPFSIFVMCLVQSITAFAAPSNTAEPENTISLAQITKDISYLASDKLKGRGNFSNELSLAAHYITKRFKDIGLIGTNNIAAKGFLQTYKISTISPNNLMLVLNDQAIAAENLTIASTMNNVSWKISNGEKTPHFSFTI
ncbi:hypothetical protein L3081_20345 [Colwellia sp. MSW7]|uniref:Peptidase M28 n=1 Tax=Colwellia maritima TaxID=2912588 RepID=A0ABS9X508_9GAMM|nr:hypothetical protein [Colwellia maritima]MCI2285301.1 hypothetical protein [Colwellia maritima]